MNASVASPDPLTARDITTLRAAGLDPIPEIASGGIVAAVGTRRLLRRQRTSYGLRGHFYFLAPHEGFTIADYLLAHHLGGTPLQADRSLPSTARDLASLRPGDVVVATLGPARRPDRVRLLRSVLQLERDGLSIAPVQSSPQMAAILSPRRAVGAVGGALVAGQWAPASAPVLPAAARAFRIPTRIPAARGVLLTFDDGPHPDGTRAVLAALEHAGITAVFFVCGEQVARHPGVVREITAAGHELGLHAYRHRTRIQWSANARR